MAEGAPLIWDGIKRNIGVVYGTSTVSRTRPSPRRPHTVKQRIVSQRVIPMPMEGRAVRGRARPDDAAD